MKTCDECGKNDWFFKTESGMTVATCKNCKNQLRWARKKTKKIVNKSMPQKCSCGGKKFDKVKKEVTVEVLKLSEYYTYYFVCSKCKNEYPDKTTRRVNLLYKE